jgi:hypothetical protein
MEQVVVNVGLIVAYILVGLGIVLAIVFPLINAISQPKLLVKAGIGLAGVIVIFGLGYALSDSATSTRFIQYGVDTPMLSQGIGGALIMVYLLMGIAIVGIVVTEFSKALK